jgi:hypothetical protein
MALTLPEFIEHGSCWMQGERVADALLEAALATLEQAFRDDGFVVGARSAPCLLRGAAAFGRRAGVRMQHPLFGWCDVQVRLTAAWPSGAALTLVAFPETDQPVRPRALRDDALTKSAWGQLEFDWAGHDAATARAALCAWLAGVPAAAVVAGLSQQAELFRSDVELALAP